MSIEILSCGDSAFNVYFGDEISPEIGGICAAFTEKLYQAPPDGFIEAVPAYCAVTVVYDCLKTDWEQIKQKLAQIAESVHGQQLKQGKTLDIPVCYEGSFAPDLDTVCKHSGLPPEQVIAVHSEAIYTVYMLGFMPGFPYLGGMDKIIATPRLEVPRTRIAPGSVGIAGEQTGIYPLASPGGWQIIGRTPLKLFDPTCSPPALLSAGMKVRFVPISTEQFEEMGGVL